MTSHSSFVFISICCGFLWGSLNASADDRSNALALHLISGMKDQRERLQSGSFRAQGKYIDLHSVEGKVEGEITIFSAFDYRKDLFRFDRSEPVRKSKDFKLAGVPATPDQLKSLAQNNAGKLIRSGNKNVYTNIGTRAAEITESAVPPTRPISAFDVRTVGLLFWLDYEKFSSLDEVLANWERSVISNVIRAQDGLWKLDCIQGNESKILCSLWIDETRGFIPVKCEVRMMLGDDQRPREIPTYTTEVSWDKVSDVWVPVSVKNVRHLRRQKDTTDYRTTSYDLTFEWEGVNNEVSDKNFDLEGLGLQRDTAIVDKRSGSPIVTKLWGRSDALVNAKRPMADRPHSFLTPRIVGLIFVNCILVILVMLSVSRKRRRIDSDN